jgi:hypothetical protein
MNVTVNGKSRRISGSLTVLQYLETIGLEPERVSPLNTTVQFCRGPILAAAISLKVILLKSFSLSVAGDLVVKLSLCKGTCLWTNL